MHVCVLTSLLSLSNTYCCVTTSAQSLSTSSPRCVSSHSFSFTKAVTCTKTHKQYIGVSIHCWLFDKLKCNGRSECASGSYVLLIYQSNLRKKFWRFQNFFGYISFIVNFHFFPYLWETHKHTNAQNNTHTDLSIKGLLCQLTERLPEWSQELLNL